MKLAQLQRSFQDHVLRDDTQITHEISGDARFSVPMRLSVYTDAYVARLIEVLAETFPAVHAVLGQGQFGRLAGEFVRQHPSRFRSARAYGGQLSQWLATRLRGPRARGIADLAQFEWAVAAAFDAADEEALSAAGLAGLAPSLWPQLRFAFSPTLQRLSVTSNCVPWWAFACAGQSRPSRWRLTGTQQWLVWRQELSVFYRRLSAAESRAVDAGRAGATFGQLCEELSTPAGAAAMLHSWFNAGLISGVSAKPYGP
ncbi:MAG TPA: DNA-binding domain-containing protein [Steroidobacteraceae bacterium]|jgi:hypothetical protein